MSKQVYKVEQTYTAKATSFNTDVVNMEGYFNLSCQVNLNNPSGFTGSTTIQVSNDLTNWIDMPDSEEDITDCVFYDIQSAAAFVRVKVVILTGSADFNVDWVLL
jgi:hypothetical protein